MDLSICVLTHCQPDLLRRCVASCFAEIERSRVTGEVIIIDNASIDGSPQQVATIFPEVRILRNEENLGFGEANNRAIRSSQGRFVLILNDDALLQEGSLELLMHGMDSDARVGAVGPTLLNPDGSPQTGFMYKRFPHLRGVACELLGLDRFLRKNRWTREWFTLWDDPDQGAEPDQVVGACLLARRSALDEVGLFDEGYFYVLEDTDLCYRLRQAGWRILCVQNARVIHFGSASYSQWTRYDQRANYFRSLAYFLRKHWSPFKYLLARLTLALVVVVRAPAGFLLEIVRRGSTYEAASQKVRADLSLLRTVLGG
jgi:GT2 family glycosyltransferase